MHKLFFTTRNAHLAYVQGGAGWEAIASMAPGTQASQADLTGSKEPIVNQREPRAGGPELEPEELERDENPRGATNHGHLVAHCLSSRPVHRHL